jgi:hypothetical protein
MISIVNDHVGGTSLGFTLFGNQERNIMDTLENNSPREAGRNMLG